MKKIVSAVALSAALTLSAGTAAYAADAEYPAPGLPVVVSAGSVQAGEEFTVSGSGLEANEAATITVAQNQSTTNFRGDTVTTTANAAGEFSEEISIDKPGRHWISVEGHESEEIGTATVVVTGPPAEGHTGPKDNKEPKELKADRSAATSPVSPAAWGAAGLGLLVTAGAAGAFMAERRQS
ncbi:MAG TPA: hypothetical protein VHH13_04555 [Arthrobacter sp.]|nr:hypothetical protein [Arthrobacter sp.]